MRGIGKAFAFAAGAIVGGVAVHFFEKKKNEELLYAKQEEMSAYYLAQIQNIYDKQDEEQKNDISEPETTEEVIEPEKTIDEEVVDAIIESYGGEAPSYKPPYPIMATQFGRTGNEEILLTYYADGVLVDDSYRVVSEDDINDFLGGRSFVKLFGEYGEMGTIHIRNERLSSDFEIDQDPRNWHDFKKTMPSFPTGRGPFDDAD